MHFVISGTWGPTDPTRAMLPFIFAASAVQDGDTVTLMLFHDAVLMAVEGAGTKLVPVGPPNRYEEVASHPAALVLPKPRPRPAIARSANSQPGEADWAAHRMTSHTVSG
jgi:hypothetical protein